jgi:hypothetical protein
VVDAGDDDDVPEEEEEDTKGDVEDDDDEEEVPMVPMDVAGMGATLTIWAGP